MKLIASCMTMGALLGAAWAEPTVTDVAVRQLWPWSSKVKVEYVVSGVTDPFALKIGFFNGETPLDAKVNGTLVGDVCVDSDGRKSFSFDPAAVFSGKTAISDLRVSLEPVLTGARVDEVIYRVYDFKTKGRTDITRADLLNGRYGSFETDYAKVGPDFATSLQDVLVWTGVTNGLTYKTDKIVFRKIPAKDQHFQFGLGDTQVYEGKGVDTWFTHDFWIAVFELTQTQFNYIKDAAIDNCHLYAEYVGYNKDKSFQYSYETNALYAAARAQGCVTFNMFRDFGSANWPAGHCSDANTQRWMGAMRRYFAGVTETDEYFDLPTSAQWEFACRAGTTTDLYSGKARSKAALCEIGRFSNVNITGRWPSDEPRMADLSVGLNVVGEYLPNAFGLYDMMGNAEEMCLDGYSSTNLPGGEDPKGVTAANSYWRTIRGCGIWEQGISGDAGASSASRYCSYNTLNTQNRDLGSVGARLVIHTHNL